MKKRLVLVGVAMGTLLLATSCRDKSTIDADNMTKENTQQMEKEVVQDMKKEEQKIPYEIPESFVKEGDKVTFNTEVIVDEKVKAEGLYKTTASLQIADYDKSYDMLFQDKETAVKDEYEENGEKSVSYQNDNYDSLSISPTILSYLTTDGFYYMHSFSEYEDDYNANLYSKDTEFDFAKRETVWKEMTDKFEKLGLHIDSEYTCYSLDYETLKKEEYVMAHNGEEDKSQYKPNWSEEDNAYFFIAQQKLQNCIVQYPIQDVFEKISQQNAPIKFLYTKGGVKMINIEGLLEFEVGEEYINLLSFEEVADRILKKYDMLLTESNYEVTRAELYFRPIQNSQGNYDMIPTWQFSIKEDITGSISETYINGVTGDEIV